MLEMLAIVYTFQELAWINLIFFNDEYILALVHRKLVNYSCRNSKSITSRTNPSNPLLEKDISK